MFSFSGLVSAALKCWETNAQLMSDLVLHFKHLDYSVLHYLPYSGTQSAGKRRKQETQL